MVKLSINEQLHPISLTTSQNRPASGSGGFLDPQRVIADLPLKEGMKIGHFGSGSGYFTILIARMVGESGLVTAVDIMETALDIVRAKAKAENLKNIDTVRSDLEVTGSSGLKNESQDMVLLANVLFESKKKKEIIEESKRVLKPEAKLVIIEWKKGINSFGPPDDLRTNPQVMSRMVTEAGLDFLNDIDAGELHYGMIFKKK